MQRRGMIVIAAAVVALVVATAACARPATDDAGAPPGLGTLPGGGSLVFNPAGRGVGVVGGSTQPTLPPKPHPVLVAAGNVACAPEPGASSTNAPPPDRCQDMATYQAALAADPDFVLALGDLQQDAGALDAFRSAYDPSWGSLRARTRPVPGMTEYRTPGATGYFDYFSGAAGAYGKGWYSFDVGGWHVIALNSECESIGGCGPDSEQGRWLAEDLQANQATRCTIGYMNRPRFSSGTTGDDASVAPLWDALAAGGADVVLAAHQQHYERLAPLGPTGAPDPTGMASFVVGTGGEGLVAPGPARPGSEQRSGAAFGALQLTLLEGGLDYSFVPAGGATLSDQGHLDCR